MDLNAVAGLGATVKSAARWWDSYDTYADEFNNRMGDGYYTGEDVFGQLAYEYARRAGVSPEEAEARFGRWADTAIQHHNYDVLNKFVADNNDNPEYVENTLGQHFDSLQRSIPGLWGRNGTKRKIETERRLMDHGGYLRSQPVVHGLTGHQILDRGDAMKRNAVANLKRQSLDAAQRSMPVTQQPVQAPSPQQVPRPAQPQPVQAPAVKRKRKARAVSRVQAPQPVQAPQVAQQAPQSEADYWENIRKQTDIQMYGVARERDPQTGKLLPPVRPGMAAKAPSVKQASENSHTLEQRRGWGGPPKKPLVNLNGADGLWNGHAPAKPHPKPYDQAASQEVRQRLSQGWEALKRQISEQGKVSK